jgi:hypothetical protein
MKPNEPSRTALMIALQRAAHQVRIQIGQQMSLDRSSASLLV